MIFFFSQKNKEIMMRDCEFICVVEYDLLFQMYSQIYQNEVRICMYGEVVDGCGGDYDSNCRDTWGLDLSREKYSILLGELYIYIVYIFYEMFIIN